MTDLTSVRSKCLLPVSGYPLVWHPLNMLQSSGFTEAIVIVPESARSEVAKLPEKYGLGLKLDIVGIPGQEDMGTADSLRLVGDRLTGSDVLIVSGDLMMEEGLRGVVDLHMMKSAAFTAVLAAPAPSTITVPGDKKAKYKKERDFIGLRGEELCMFAAEADMEDEVRISSKVMKNVGSFTVHTNLVDSHLYIMKKWVCDYIISDRNLSTIKGEVLPILVKKQFSKAKEQNKDEEFERKSLQDFVESGKTYKLDKGNKLYSCYAYTTQLPCYRVNTIPTYWQCNSIVRKENKIHPGATLGDKAQLSGCQVSGGCEIADKTTLVSVSLGQGTRVMEKVRLTNCVIMDNVTIMSGAVLEDCIICDGATIGEKSSVKMSVVGKCQNVENGAQVTSQLLLDSDRMMEV